MMENLDISLSVPSCGGKKRLSMKRDIVFSAGEHTPLAITRFLLDI